MRVMGWRMGLLVLSLVATPYVVCAQGAAPSSTYMAGSEHSPMTVYVQASQARPALTDDLGQSVDTATLAGMTGGTLVIQNTTLNGTVSNNSATYVQTGDNVITGGSLSNATGIPTVIQNSGSNVLIQNAMVLNVEFKQ